MRSESKLNEMVRGYAAAHRHPFNVAVHLIGIPVIMLGVFVPMRRVSVTAGDLEFNLAQVTVVGLFLFYLSLDAIFALAFLCLATAVVWCAGRIAELPQALAWTIAAAAFFGGYALQFVGHAIERSAPVILKHPIQAKLRRAVLHRRRNLSSRRPAPLAAGKVSGSDLGNPLIFRSFDVSAGVIGWGRTSATR